MKKMASNATMWMASPTSTTGPARVTTVNQEILRYITYFFGGFSLVLLLIALAFAIRDETSWKSVGLVGAVTLLNLGFDFWALHSKNPLRLLVVQTFLGGLLCPLAYLGTDGALAPWWPGYALMSFSGAVAWGLEMSSPLWGRFVLLYYMVNFVLATVFGVSQPSYYELALRVSLIGITGLMLTQLTEVLSQSLSKVYERSLQHRKAKEELQELTRLKTDFFANVSHEFRTPITLTLGPLEAVLKGRYGETSEEMRGQIGVMIRNQQRLLGLINQILDVSKVEAGAIELKVSRIPDFNRFVLDRLESFAATAESRKIELKHSFDPLVKGMEIYIDQEKFDKILLNLLSNALKFTKQGHIELATEIQGDRLAMKVSDSGIGIRDTELPHVFDRFRQADGSMTREFAGTGLGLALVQEFTKLHGGEVTVTSRYGQGTSFIVKIPIGKAHYSPKSIIDFVDEDGSASGPAFANAPAAPEAPSNCVELNAETELSHDSKKATVICAEDNPELRAFLRDMLKETYNIYVGANGRQGLELAKKLHPDLILSDLMMPVMSGLDFCKKIRQDPALRPIPFILLTARSMASSKLEGLEEGADDYLTKPFSESELLARVKNLVAFHRQQLKLERELEAARAIQFSLLPVPPQRFDGALLDFHYHPSEGLSGDFCDILHKGDWIYFYLADVTSHGTASAQVTYLLKEIFAHLVGNGHADPPLTDLIREAQNRYASHHLKYDVAFQLARFHLRDRTLEVLRANTPTPIKVTAGSSPQSLRVKPSPALTSEGGASEGSFHLAEFKLEAGDAIYFFTDGCYEFPTKEGPFGMRRFQELLNAAAPGEQWKANMFQALVTAHGKAQFPDDITFLRLQVG